MGSSLSHQDPDEAKQEARAQWGHDPAGAFAAGSEPLGTPESFARIEAYRYRAQPWMHETFRFSQWSGSRVLEVGVGLGTDHVQFARGGAEMSGIDLTPRSIELTKQRVEQEGLRSNLSVMDAESMEFEDDSFDVVYSFGVLHHTTSAERAFAEVRRVLRPGGVFLGGLYSKHSYFYARLRIERIVYGQFRRETLEETISRIEHSTSDARPYVRLFTARKLRGALEDAGFGSVRLRRRQMGLGDWSERLPTWIAAPGGWFLIHEAR
jgi:ubiquinone/menaquinone biosynthesis C-methylase UbiE